MSFFAVFLRKLEPSCKIGSYSSAIIRKVLYRKWPPPLFADITSTKRCETPVFEKRLCASQGREFP